MNGQSQEPYSVRILNASHRLLTIRANEHCAWLAFVELLFRSAGTLFHIASPPCLRVEAGVCFAMVDGLSKKNFRGDDENFWGPGYLGELLSGGAVGESVRVV